MHAASERLVWGFGDGSTLDVASTPLGRIGTAICWENYTADGIEDEAERSSAHARINELSATLDAWEAERDRALDDESVTGGRAVADEASDAAAAIARQAIALPARTLPGVWVKVRNAAFYGEADPTASPADGYTGEAVLRSLYRDAPRLVLDAETADICIVPEV